MNIGCSVIDIDRTERDHDWDAHVRHCEAFEQVPEEYFQRKIGRMLDLTGLVPDSITIGHPDIPGAFHIYRNQGNLRYRRETMEDMQAALDRAFGGWTVDDDDD